MKKVLVCCGAGVATSTMVAMKIEDLMSQKGVTVKCNHCKIVEVASMVDEYDMLVTNVKMEHDVSVPVIQGLPFLTGIGVDKVIDDMIQQLGE